jgi:hypothetical protein
MIFVLVDKINYGVNGVNTFMKHMHHKFYIPDVSVSRKRNDTNKNHNDHAKMSFQAKQLKTKAR